MAADRLLDIVRFTGAEVSHLGETVSISARTGSGENVVLRFDSEALEEQLPALMGTVEIARRKAEAGIPTTGTAGERIIAKSRRITGFAVHSAKAGVALEFHLSPTRMPLVLAIPRELVRQLCTRLLQTLDQD